MSMLCICDADAVRRETKPKTTAYQANCRALAHTRSATFACAGDPLYPKQQRTRDWSGTTATKPPSAIGKPQCAVHEYLAPACVHPPRTHMCVGHFARALRLAARESHIVLLHSDAAGPLVFGVSDINMRRWCWHDVEWRRRSRGCDGHSFATACRLGTTAVVVYKFV